MTQPPILQALSGTRPARTPMWLMRQAGRVLPEYRALKQRHSFLELMRSAELSTEVTLMPLRRFAELDAAILFTDLLVPLEAMGMPLDYDPGPVLGWRFEGPGDLDRLAPADPEERLSVLLETARRVKRELRPDQALLGFVGAPFTLGAYAMEGQGSKSWHRLRALAYRDPGLCDALCERLTAAALAFGLALGRAGCDAVQVFDSWAGVVEPGLYRERFGPWLDRLVGGLRDAGTPVIMYCNGARPHLETMLATGADCLGLDWRTDMAAFDAVLPAGLPVQGNLDPCALYGTTDSISREAWRVLRAARGRPHVFNLGHGLEPTTPLEGVEALIDAVRAFDEEEGE
ncbi:MAG: uroporphyrinogen decarboxylase [Planctomycetota bacterium]